MGLYIIETKVVSKKRKTRCCLNYCSCYIRSEASDIFLYFCESLEIIMRNSPELKDLGLNIVL